MLSTTALGKEIVGALYADVSERMPSIAGALPADERHRLASFIARITAPTRLTALLAPSTDRPSADAGRSPIGLAGHRRWRPWTDCYWRSASWYACLAADAGQQDAGHAGPSELGRFRSRSSS